MASSSERARHSVSEGELAPWLRWVVPLTLFVASWLPYLPALSFGFVDYDDDRNFYPQFNPWFNATNHALGGTTLEWMLHASHYGHYQPLTWISYGIDAAVTGRFDPKDFHRTNVLLHAVNAVLVYWLARRLLQAAASGRARAGPLMLAAAATSLLYALHPLRVESVAWITERRDVLSGTFLLLAVGTYLRYVASGERKLWILLSLACYAVSLLAKAWGITLPAVLLVLDLYPLRRRSESPPVAWRRIVGEKLAYAPLALAFAVLAARAQAEILATVSWKEHGFVQRLAQACYGLAFYVYKTVWPAELSPLYLLEAVLDPARPVYLACMAIVAVTVAALVALRRKIPGVVAAAVAYAILVSPVLGFLQSGAQKVADRYMYLAAVPLTLLVGALVLKLASAPRGERNVRRLAVVGAGVGLVAVLLGTLAHAQTFVWRDSESVYGRIVEVEPDNYFGQHCLSVTILQRRSGDRKQNLEEALVHARLSVAAHQGAGNVEGRRNVAFILRALGRQAESERELEAALEVAPDWLPTLQDLTSARLARGDLDGALAAVQRSLALAPKFLDGYAELATVRGKRGEPELALEAWQKGLDVDSNWPAGLHALAVAALDAGDAARAEKLLVKAAARGARDPEILIELGRACEAQGRLDEAELRYRQALSIAPNHPRAQALLQGLGGPRKP
jgi:tetratricopeptide (TPR) repeat protein